MGRSHHRLSRGKLGAGRRAVVPGRRPRPEPPEPPFQPAEPTFRGEPVWLEAYPDTLLDGLPGTAPGPDTLYEAKENQHRHQRPARPPSRRRLRPGHRLPANWQHPWRCRPRLGRHPARARAKPCGPAGLSPSPQPSQSQPSRSARRAHDDHDQPVRPSRPARPRAEPVAGQHPCHIRNSDESTISITERARYTEFSSCARPVRGGLSHQNSVYLCGKAAARPRGGRWQPLPPSRP
jgi:hypothetical protein